MHEKTYNFIIRLKKAGDFDTIFASKIEGDPLTDQMLKVEITKKDGGKRTVYINVNAIETIDDVSVPTIESDATE